MIKTHCPSTTSTPLGQSARSNSACRRRVSVGWLLAMLCFVSNHASALVSGNYEYEVTGSTVKITGYVVEPTGAMAIPGLIDNKPVTAIGSQAFGLSSGLSSVTFPSSLTSIETSAFVFCDGLTSVTLPANLTNIGDSAFAYCSALSTISIPSGVTIIGSSVFSACSGLQSVTFLGPVTSIGTNAFNGCSGLTSFTFPSSVTTLGGSAFSGCSGLTAITIPSGVSSLPTGVFAGCSGLQTVTIPASVTSIGTQSFYLCSALLEARFLGNAPSIGSNAFGAVAAGFKVYHTAAATGFDVAPWTGYSQGVTEADPVGDWLVANGLPANSNLQSDSNHDGVSLLMAYALNFNPNQNLTLVMPQPVFTPTQMSLTFFQASDVITYKVETSTDMLNWSTVGVTLSAPDANHNRTGTVSRTGANRYMRLSVSY